PWLGLEVRGPMREVIEKALAPEREQRYAGLTEVLQAVEAVPPRLTADQVRQLLRAAAAVAAGRGLGKSEPPAPPRSVPPPPAGEIRARLGRIEEVLRALEPDSDPSRLVARRAAGLCAMRRFEEAEKELQAALLAAPLSAALHLELGRVHSAQGDSNRGHAFV